MSLPVGPLWSVLHLGLKFPGVSAIAAIAYFTSPQWYNTPITTIDSTRPMVAFTFDDGYEQVAKYALPEMKSRRMVGTHYITTNHLDQYGFIATADVSTFVDAEWEVGSHGVSHDDMTALNPQYLNGQLITSKSILETLTGVKISSFSTPFGAFNDAVISAVSARYSNHVNAWSDADGINTLDNFDPYNVHRIDYRNTSVTEICRTVTMLPTDSMYVIIFHDFSDPKEKPRDVFMYDIDPKDFEAILDCVEEAEVNVVRVSDGVVSMKERAARVRF